MKLLQWLQDKAISWLANFPEKEEHITREALRYWLRRERQSKLDLKGVVE